MSKDEATVSLPQEHKKITVEQFSVNAHRDKFSYDVSFESHEIYDPPRPGAHVAVHVGKDSRKSPLVNEGHEEKSAAPRIVMVQAVRTSRRAYTSNLRFKELWEVRQKSFKYHSYGGCAW